MGPRRKVEPSEVPALRDYFPVPVTEPVKGAENPNKPMLPAVGMFDLAVVRENDCHPQLPFSLDTLFAIIPFEAALWGVALIVHGNDCAAVFSSKDA